MKFVSIILALVLLASCTTRNTQMSLIVPEGNGAFLHNMEQARLVKDVEGESTSYVLVFIALGQPSFKEAIDDILTKTKGVALVNAKISYVTEWYLLFGFNRLKIKADVIKLQGR